MADADALKTSHAKALDQFRFVAEVESDQRKSELEALRFEVGDQWTDDAKIARAGLPANTASGAPAVPARPMLTMRTLDQPLAQISSMAAQADLGIKIVPKDGKAREETADVIAGLVRSIEADSHASYAYNWGFKRMRSCGRGYWRVNKAYASDTGGFDQVLRIEPIENGASVYLDPMAKWQASGGFWEPEFGFITEDLTKDAYIRRYGQEAFDKASDGELLTAIGDNKQHWVIESADGTTYRTAEYFYATYDETKETSPDKALPPRDIISRKVMWGKLDGTHWLDEPQEWDGRYLPVIQDSGNKYNVGGKVVYEGMIQPNISPCRMVNFTVSSAMEKIGIATKSPWIGVAGQFQGFEAWWDQANTRTFSKLEYNAKTASTGENILPPPMQNNVEPAIQSVTEMMGVFINFIRSGTGVPDAALGHVNPNDKSGKAIEALKQASEQGTSGWLKLHADAIRHTGVVLVDLIPHVYDTPGRVERILGTDGKPETVMLNAPFTRGQDGQPQAQPPQAPPGLMGRIGAGLRSMVGAQPQQPETEHHKLSEGQYSVIVDVGKSTPTQQSDTLIGLSALAQAVPELVPRFADIWVKSMPLKPEVADAIAERIAPPGTDDQDMPPQAQAMISQLQAQVQELSQLADDNKTKLAIAQGNAETDLKKAALQESADSQRNRENNEVKLAVAELGAKMERMALFLEERARLGVEGHDVGMAAMAQQHDLEMADQAHQQALAQGQQDHQQGLEAGEVGHQQALEQSQMPKPIDPNAQSGAE